MVILSASLLSVSHSSMLIFVMIVLDEEECGTETRLDAHVGASLSLAGLSSASAGNLRDRSVEQVDFAGTWRAADPINLLLDCAWDVGLADCSCPAGQRLRHGSRLPRSCTLPIEGSSDTDNAQPRFKRSRQTRHCAALNTKNSSLQPSLLLLTNIMPPLLQDVFALSGIIAASRVTLQRYLAIASHRPSDQWVPREDEPGPSDANDLAEGTTPKTAFIITLIGAVAFPVLRLVIWLVADYAPVGLALVFFTLLLYLMHVGMVYMVRLAYASLT